MAKGLHGGAMMRFLIVTTMMFAVGVVSIACAETQRTNITKGEKSRKLWENKGPPASDDVKILIKNVGDGKILVQPGNTIVPGHSAFLLLVRRGNVAIDDASESDGNGTELEYDIITEDFSMSYVVKIPPGTVNQKVFEVANGSLSPSGRFSITHAGGSGTVKIRPSNTELSGNSRPLELSVDSKNIVIDSVSGESQLTIKATILEALH
jgi:hypothetical protein